MSAGCYDEADRARQDSEAVDSIQSIAEEKSQLDIDTDLEAGNAVSPEQKTHDEAPLADHKPKQDSLAFDKAGQHAANEGKEGHTLPSNDRPYSIFTKSRKRFIVIMVAVAGFFSPLSANIYFPALNPLAKDLRVSNAQITLSVTSYMIFQGIAPTIFGDLADMIGRRPVYLVGFIIYLGANVGLALQRNYVALVILRCLQSSGSSGFVAMGTGVVTDIATSGERGKYMGIVQLGFMAAPAIAPILGGILAQFLGWPSLFWFLTIFAASFALLFLMLFPETGRNIVDNGSDSPQPWNRPVIDYVQNSRRKNPTPPASQGEKINNQGRLASQRRIRIPNPFRAIQIILEKDVALLLIFNSLVFVSYYDVTTSLPSLFAQIYGFNELQIGLSFIPLGVGCSIASILFGRLTDLNYRRVAKQAGFHVDIKKGDDMRHFPIEKARIQVIIVPLYIGITTLLCYGWALERNAPLPVTLILTFVIGLTLTGCFNVISTILIDLYPKSPATATSANNLVRCLVGAAGTAVVAQMIDGLGRGWCFTLLATILVLASPLLWVVEKRGPSWREERRKRVEAKAIHSQDGDRN